MAIPSISWVLSQTTTLLSCLINLLIVALAVRDISYVCRDLGTVGSSQQQLLPMSWNSDLGDISCAGWGILSGETAVLILWAFQASLMVHCGNRTWLLLCWQNILCLALPKIIYTTTACFLEVAFLTGLRLFLLERVYGLFCRLIHAALTTASLARFARYSMQFSLYKEW